MKDYFGGWSLDFLLCNHLSMDVTWEEKEKTGAVMW
jgi:hypothetical protein